MTPPRTARADVADPTVDSAAPADLATRKAAKKAPAKKAAGKKDVPAPSADDSADEPSLDELDADPAELAADPVEGAVLDTAVAAMRKHGFLLEDTE